MDNPGAGCGWRWSTAVATRVAAWAGPDATPTADSTAANERTRGPTPELIDSLRRLPMRQRTVVVLRFYEDLAEADIARIMGVRVGR